MDAVTPLRHRRRALRRLLLPVPGRPARPSTTTRPTPRTAPASPTSPTGGATTSTCWCSELRPAHQGGQAVGRSSASARSAVWRNAGTDPLGSRHRRACSPTTTIYADTRKWVQRGLDRLHRAADLLEHRLRRRPTTRSSSAWWAERGHGHRRAALRRPGRLQGRCVRPGRRLAGPGRAQRPPDVNRRLPRGRRRHLLQRQGRQGRPDRRRLPPGRPTTTPGPRCCPPAARRRRARRPAITSATRGSGGVAAAWQAAAPPSYAVYRVTAPGRPPTRAPSPTPATCSAPTRADRTFTDTTADRRPDLHLLRDRAGPAAPGEPAERGRAVAAGSAARSASIVDNTDRRVHRRAPRWGTSAFSAQLHGADYRFADPRGGQRPGLVQGEHPQRRQLPGRGLVSGRRRLQQRHAVHRGHRGRQPDRHRRPAHRRRPVAGARHLHPRRGRPQRGRGEPLDHHPGYVVADAVRITRL